MSCHSPLFNRGKLYMALCQESLPSPRLNSTICTDQDSIACVLAARETLLSIIEWKDHWLEASLTRLCLSKKIWCRNELMNLSKRSGRLVQVQKAWTSNNGMRWLPSTYDEIRVASADYLPQTGGNNAHIAVEICDRLQSGRKSAWHL